MNAFLRHSQLTARQSQASDDTVVYQSIALSLQGYALGELLDPGSWLVHWVAHYLMVSIKPVSWL
jgi:hypothetical protein